MPTKQTISLSIRISCALIVLSAALLIASPAQAATVTWDGGGGDNNWSTGANWDTGSAPTDADDVVLDATSTKDMTIDGDYTVNSFSMNSGYTGTVTQASGSDLVTDSTDFTVNAGTFTMVSDSTVTSQLDVNIGGGTFNAAGTTYLRRDWNETSGTFSHSNGTVQTVDSPQSDFDVPTSANFYNLTITKASGSDFAVATGDTINVTNTLSLSQGDLTGSGTLDAEGALSFDTGWTGGSGNLTITGAATRSTDLEDTITLPDNVTINAANFTLNGAPSGNVTGGTITLTSGTLALNSGSLTLTDSSVGLLIQGGTLTAGGGNIDLSAGSFQMTSGTFTGSTGNLDTDEDFTLSGGTFTAPTGTLYVKDDWTHTGGGTFTHNNGTVEAYGNVQATFDVASTESFYNFTVNKDNGTQMIVASGDTLTAANQLTLTDGNLNTGTFNTENLLSNGTNFDGGTGTVGITGSATRSISMSSGTITDTFTINAANATVNAPTSGTLTGDTMNVTNGTFVIGDGNVTLANSSTGMTIDGGTVTHSGSGTLDLSQGSLVMTSGSFTGGAGTVDTDEDFTLSGGIFTAPTGTFYVRDDWTHTAGGTFTHNNGTVEDY